MALSGKPEYVYGAGSHSAAKDCSPDFDHGKTRKSSFEEVETSEILASAQMGQVEVRNANDDDAILRQINDICPPTAQEHPSG